MKNKNVLVIVLLLLAVPFLSGCGEKNEPKISDLNDLAKKEDNRNIEEVLFTTSTNSSKMVKPNNENTEKEAVNKLNKNNSMDQFDENKQYFALVRTSLGDFTIKFNKGQTPKTVENFVTLAKKGFYDKTIFHRVIKGFMIQGGDPVGNGTGGPGYKFADEPFDGEYVRGAVAMANSGPNTNGSQFFVMHADYPLPKNYTIFGNVASGMETVDKIAESEVKAGVFGENSTPVNPTVIKSIEITEK